MLILILKYFFDSVIIMIKKMNIKRQKNSNRDQEITRNQINSMKFIRRFPVTHSFFFLFFLFYIVRLKINKALFLQLDTNSVKNTGFLFGPLTEGRKTKEKNPCGSGKNNTTNKLKSHMIQPAQGLEPGPQRCHNDITYFVRFVVFSPQNFHDIQLVFLYRFKLLRSFINVTNAMDIFNH